MKWERLTCPVRCSGAEKNKEEKTVEKTMAKNFPKPMKDIIYRSQSLMKSIRMNAKIPRTRHLIVKLQSNKDKEKAIKAARRISYKGMTINLQQQ